MSCFQIGKGVHQGYILSPCLFNLYTRVHHVKCWAGWNKSWNQDFWRDINNLRYADDTSFMAESEEEPKSLLMKVKGNSEKAGLKFSIQKTKILSSGPYISWQKNGETMETVTGFIFFGSRITMNGDCSHKIKGCFHLGRKAWET